MSQDDSPSTEARSSKNSEEEPVDGQATQPDAHGPEPDVKSRSDSDSPPRDGRGRGATIVAWLAVVVAIAALALASRPYWSGVFGGEIAGDVASEQINDLDRRLADMQLRLDGRDARFDDRFDDGFNSRFDSRFDMRLDDQLDKRLDNRLDERLDERLAEFEQSLGEGRDRDDESLDARFESLSSRLDAIEQQDVPGTADLERLSERIGRVEGDQSSTEAALSARVDALEERVEQRVQGLQEQLAGIGGDLESADRILTERLALAHVESLLIEGRDRLELSGDPTAMIRAWRRAVQRLEAVDAPQFETLRELLGEQIEALEQAPGTRLASRVRALDRLAGEARDWPARATTGGAEAETAQDPDMESNGWRQRLAGVVDRLVTVESVDAALPSPIEVERGRTRIEQALQAAALATARRDWDLNAALIDSAMDTAARVLDTEAASMVDARARLESLREPPEGGSRSIDPDAALALLGELGEDRR